MSDGESVTDFDSRPEAIRRTIEARIAAGKIRPGDRLGLKADLQREFDVAGPTISQALTLLTNDGLISMRRGSGWRHLRRANVPDPSRSGTQRLSRAPRVPGREHRDPRVAESAAGLSRQAGPANRPEAMVSEAAGARQRNWWARHPRSRRNA